MSLLLPQILDKESLDIALKYNLQEKLESVLKEFRLKKLDEKAVKEKMKEIILQKSEQLKNQKNLKFEHFKTLIDEGDYIQATGKLDYSQSGEPSLFVEQYKILTKAIRPLPEIIDYENFEARYLDRVSDLKLNTKDDKNQSVRDMLKLKSKYWQIWREEMTDAGFLEVETPTLEAIPGGAEAKTFTTYYNELEQEVHLRISPELSLKKLVAGGFERVFEIGKNFRNEGSSPQHLQEYTAIEWYCCYQDYDFGMSLTKKIYQRIINELLGSQIQTDYYNNQINWGQWCSQSEAEKNGWELLDGWPKIKYFDAVRYFSKGEIDIENKTANELVQIAKSQGIEDAKEDWGMATLLDKLWKKARVNTKNPFFLVLPPVELEPLAKRHPSNPSLTQRFQIVAGTAELGKGFSELNDPIDQYERFQDQQKARDAGNDEAQFMNEDYVKSLEYGTPPLCGFGTSERFFSFILSKHIKECVTFPAIRKNLSEVREKPKAMVAHVITLSEEGLSIASKTTTISYLTAYLGAELGKKSLVTKKNQTFEGDNISVNLQYNIVNKTCQDSQSMLQLKNLAKSKGLLAIGLVEENKNGKIIQQVWEQDDSVKAKTMRWLGVLIFGKKSEVETLTDHLEFI